MSNLSSDPSRRPLNGSMAPLPACAADWLMRAQLHLFAPVVIALSMVVVTQQASGSEQPAELGDVAWLRHLDEAIEESGRSGKPILLLFQEVPGCETCKTFGANPLSHPLLVEAIEELFVPLAIHNNKPGHDEAVLKQFEEPAWNNPVVRYINSDKEDVIPREDRKWTTGAMAARMVQALTATQTEVPSYLQLLVDELTGDRSSAIVAMHCYWEGEGQLGAVEAVERTRSGWLHGKEVVEITYDSSKAKYEDILRIAKTVKCANHVFASSEVEADQARKSVGLPATILGSDTKDQFEVAKDSDQQYYLRQSPHRHLPLTPLQATRINAALRLSKDASHYLSPRQKTMLLAIDRVTKEQPGFLAGFQTPVDDADLPNYEKRLRKKLQLTRQH